MPDVWINPKKYNQAAVTYHTIYHGGLERARFLQDADMDMLTAIGLHECATCVRIREDAEVTKTVWSELGALGVNFYDIAEKLSTINVELRLLHYPEDKKTPRVLYSSRDKLSRFDAAPEED